MTPQRKYHSHPTRKQAAPFMDAIKARCTECPECGKPWNWTGNHKNRMHHAVVERDKTRIGVRRAVWATYRGAMPADTVLTTTCDNPCCLNPALIAAITKGAVIERSTEQGLIHTAAHVAARTLARRAVKTTKLSMDIAREVRQNTDITPAEYGARLNVHPGMIRRIRSNLSYRDGNPFAGLMQPKRSA